MHRNIEDICHQLCSVGTGQLPIVVTWGAVLDIRAVGCLRAGVSAVGLLVFEANRATYIYICECDSYYCVYCVYFTYS